MQRSAEAAAAAAAASPMSAFVYIFRFGFVLLATGTGRLIPGVGTPGSSCHGHEAPVPSAPAVFLDLRGGIYRRYRACEIAIFTMIMLLSRPTLPSPDSPRSRNRCLSLKPKKIYFASTVDPGLILATSRFLSWANQQD